MIWVGNFQRDNLFIAVIFRAGIFGIIDQVQKDLQDLVLVYVWG